MLPPFKHRLVIGLVLLAGALCWLLARQALTPADGSTGLSLMDAQAGLFAAIMILVLAGLPAAVAGLIASSTGNPLAGTFTLSFSLLPLAALGGSIEGWFRRSELPGDYKSLAFEAVIWIVLLAVVFIAIDLLRKSVRPSLGVIAVKRHHGAHTKLTAFDGKSILAGLIAAAAGAFACNLLIRSVDGGQVNCSLMLGFCAAGLIAQTSVPGRNPIVILLSPLLVAIGAYLYVATQYPKTDDLLHDLYTLNTLKLSLALPIQYASSGVAGCALGIGLAQTMDHAKNSVVATA